MRVGVAIVDDEGPARALLRRYVSEHPTLQFAGEAASGTEALELIRRARPALLLLDIEMPAPDGFGVLEALTAHDDNRLPSFIFVTAFDHYAVRAFEVNAVDYLLKPVTQDRFNRAIERYLASNGAPPPVRGLLQDALHLPPERILVRERGRIVPVPVTAIDWIESEGDYARLHTAGKSHLVEKSLGELEGLLATRGFARVHRRAIVNLERVAELHPEGSGRYRLLLRGGTELIASRSYSGRFRNGVL